MTNLTKKIRVLIGAVLAGFCFQASAVLIYDNSVNDLNIRFNSGVFEVGDEIRLAGNARFLQRFEVEYFGIRNGSGTPSGPFTGNVQAQVRLYLNNGPLFNTFPTPGTVLYDSGLFAVGATTERSTFVFDAGSQFPAGGLNLGNITNLTFSLQFSGLGAGDALGVDLYNPPVVGSSAPDYWERTNTASPWTLQTFPNGVPPANFAARLTASVPDTTGISIFLASLFSLFVFSRIVRRDAPAKS